MDNSSRITSSNFSLSAWGNWINDVTSPKASLAMRKIRQIEKENRCVKRIEGLLLLPLARAVDAIWHANLVWIKLAVGVAGTPVHLVGKCFGKKLMENWNWIVATKHMIQVFRHAKRTSYFLNYLVKPEIEKKRVFPQPKPQEQPKRDEGSTNPPSPDSTPEAPPPPPQKDTTKKEPADEIPSPVPSQDKPSPAQQTPPEEDAAEDSTTPASNAPLPSTPNKKKSRRNAPLPTLPTTTTTTTTENVEEGVQPSNSTSTSAVKPSSEGPTLQDKIAAVQLKSAAGRPKPQSEDDVQSAQFRLQVIETIKAMRARNGTTDEDSEDVSDDESDAEWYNLVTICAEPKPDRQAIKTNDELKTLLRLLRRQSKDSFQPKTHHNKDNEDNVCLEENKDNEGNACQPYLTTEDTEYSLKEPRGSDALQKIMDLNTQVMEKYYKILFQLSKEGESMTSEGQPERFLISTYPRAVREIVKLEAIQEAAGNILLPGNGSVTTGRRKKGATTRAGRRGKSTNNRQNPFV